MAYISDDTEYISFLKMYEETGFCRIKVPKMKRKSGWGSVFHFIRTTVKVINTAVECGLLHAEFCDHMPSYVANSSHCGTWLRKGKLLESETVILAKMAGGHQHRAMGEERRITIWSPTTIGTADIV